MHDGTNVQKLKDRWGPSCRSAAQLPRPTLPGSSLRTVVHSHRPIAAHIIPISWFRDFVHLDLNVPLPQSRTSSNAQLFERSRSNAYSEGNNMSSTVVHSPRCWPGSLEIPHDQSHTAPNSWLPGVAIKRGAESEWQSFPLGP